MRPLKIIPFLLLGALFSSKALALGAVSRACRFSDIPSSLKPVAGAFFTAIGGSSYSAVLPFTSIAEQGRYWIMESLTTDYLRTRYYLYAQNTTYERNPFVDSANYNKWQIIGGYSSPVWTAETVSDALKAAPRFSPYFANRGLLFSARAGDPKIITTDDWPSTQRATLGHHWYYDPVSKVAARMSDTTAYDCNLGDYGFGHGIFDR